MLLVNHPDKLKKLMEELDTAFPSKDDPITFAKTQDLPYLNAVCNESMRRMPIVAVGMSRRILSKGETEINRTCTMDYTDRNHFWL